MFFFSRDKYRLKYVFKEESAKNFVRTAISSLCLWSKEEDIKINFDAWIWPYIDLLEEVKKNQSIDTAPCSIED